MNIKRHLAIISSFFIIGGMAFLSPQSVADSPPATSLSATLPPGDMRLVAIESQIAKLINEERAHQHLPLLAYDSQLASVARAHSAEMRDKKYFSHQSPTLQLEWPLNRYQQGFGKTPQLVAENLYRDWNTERGLAANAADRAHRALMESAGHRANILQSRVTRMGIGVATDERGSIWITQMFVRP